MPNTSRQHMNPKPFSASSLWLAAIASLLVALGTQTLIENIHPLSMLELLSSQGAVVYQFVEGSRWRYETAVRFASFAAGGAIAVLLARGISRWLAASLVVVAIVATAFSQYPSLAGLPSGALLVPMTLWSLAAPAGVILGAWLTGRNRASQETSSR